MSVLVTGANGYIGGAISERLIIQGMNVRAAVRKVSNFDFECQSPFLGINADWSSLLKGTSVVIHTAARAHVLNDPSDDPIALFREVNTIGTLVLARQAAAMNVKRFIFLSSIGVNGIDSVIPFNELDLPNPIEPYAVSKLEAENGLLDIAKNTGMEVVIIRPPLVYGPNAPGNFGKLANAVRRGLPLPFGSLTRNRRTLLGLDNLVDLVFTCLHHPAAANQIFLAGDNEDISTSDLIRKMACVFKVSSRLFPFPLTLLEFAANVVGRKAMVNRLCGSLQVDIGKARSLLGWNPPLTLDQGLMKVADGRAK